jgi:hypothetical protein
MKYFQHFLITAIFVLVVLFWIDSETRYRDFTDRIEVELMTRDIRIQQLEKEVRLLKTDLDIIENGFSEK